MDELTRILNAVSQGDPRASDQLLPLVYEELRRLARSKLAHEPSGQTLQPTALVHEAYLRLVDSSQQPSWNSRGHFFAAAAQSMRRILVENARRRKSLRRGGGKRPVSLNNIDLGDPNDCEFLTALDRLLEQLGEQYRAVAQVVDLRFFAGLSIEQTAEAMDLSVRTVNRHWAFARAWLYQQLSGDCPASE